MENFTVFIFKKDCFTWTYVLTMCKHIDKLNQQILNIRGLLLITSTWLYVFSLLHSILVILVEVY